MLHTIAYAHTTQFVAAFFFCSCYSVYRFCFALSLSLHFIPLAKCIGIISSASKHFSRCFILLLSEKYRCRRTRCCLTIVCCIFMLVRVYSTHVSMLDFQFFPFVFSLNRDIVFIAFPLMHVFKNIQCWKKKCKLIAALLFSVSRLFVQFLKHVLR